MKKYLIYFRNGLAFVYAWLVLVIVIYAFAFTNGNIKAVFLLFVLLYSAIAVTLFILYFKDIVFKKMDFKLRLSLFMFSMLIENFIFFYCSGYLTMGIELLILVVMIIALYGMCIIIFNVYSRKKSVEYTLSLQKYKVERKREYERL